MAKQIAEKQLAEGLDKIRQRLQLQAEAFGSCSEKEVQKRLKRCAKDLYQFGKTYFPHFMTIKSSRFHKEFSKGLTSLVLKHGGKRSSTAAPRGSAKSVWASEILLMWCICYKYRHNILIFSNTGDVAEEHIAVIRHELEMNPRLRQDFPEACGEGPTWQQGEIITCNNIRLKAFGSGKQVRGTRHGIYRPDLVILDDMENDENVESDGQRAKLKKWFNRAVMGSGQVGKTDFVMVFTVLHPQSLGVELLNRPGWQGKIYQAIEKWSDSPLWERWADLYNESEALADTFYLEHKKELLEGTRVLWPEGQPYVELMKIYYALVADGSVSDFFSEYQNEANDPDSQTFPEEIFQYYDPSELVGKTLRKVGAVDPSLGKKKGCPSAIVTLARDETSGLIYVLQGDIWARKPDIIIKDTEASYLEHQQQEMVCEEVQFQEFLKDEMIKRSRQNGVYIPITGTRPNKDKHLRIESLQPHIKNGTIRFLKRQQTLLGQFWNYPKGMVDGPDALEMAFKRFNSSRKPGRILSAVKRITTRYQGY